MGRKGSERVGMGQDGSERVGKGRKGSERVGKGRDGQDGSERVGMGRGRKGVHSGRCAIRVGLVVIVGAFVDLLIGDLLNLSSSWCAYRGRKCEI